jgi:hypothetical protein
MQPPRIKLNQVLNKLDTPKGGLNKLAKVVEPEGPFPDLPADFQKQAQADWNIMAKLRRGKGPRPR